MSVGVLTEENMENLVELWRAKPDELTLAIQQQRQAFFQPPQVRLPDISQRFLVGAGNDGATLLGHVITDQFCDPEITRVLEEVRTLAQGLANAEQLHLQLQFFLPPDASCSKVQAGIEGVPVDWFMWVPLSEDNIRIVKHVGFPLTHAEGSVEATIARLLRHLKWFADLAEFEPCANPPIGWAFKIYNAAVRLQFHLTFSRGLMEHASREEVSRFLSALEKLVKTGASITAPLRTPEGLAAARNTTIRKADRESLIKGVAKVLKAAVKAGVVAEIAAARDKAFEKAINVSEMFQQLREEGWGNAATAKGAEDRLEEQEPEVAEFCRALAGVIAARSPAVTESLRPAVKAAAQDLSRDFLAVASKHVGKQHRALAKSGSALVAALVAVEEWPSTPRP